MRLLICLLPLLLSGRPDTPWVRHTLDATSRGADGVRLADADGDGRLDVVTGWEEGGVVRVYVHPGPDRVRAPWPHVTVGFVNAVEDAVFADLDADGTPEVVSAAEGSTRRLYVHWPPTDPTRWMDPDAWTTESLPAAENRMQWMFTHPVPGSASSPPILWAAGKNEGAQIGRFEASGSPRTPAAWAWTPVSDAGWVMTLDTADMDADGDLDVVLSDRRGPLRGVRWLENPGSSADPEMPWANHFVGGRDHEVMFMTLADLDRDGDEDAIAATSGQTLLAFERLDASGLRWATHAIALPEGTGTGKGIRVGDLNGDGRPDLVFSCEHAADKSGVMWLSATGNPWTDPWQPHDISGLPGTKFDLIQLIDLDDDGDLDVLTCEEVENLGVVWYENPLG